MSFCASRLLRLKEQWDNADEDEMSLCHERWGGGKGDYGMSCHLRFVNIAIQVGSLHYFTVTYEIHLVTATGNNIFFVSRVESSRVELDSRIMFPNFP